MSDFTFFEAKARDVRPTIYVYRLVGVRSHEGYVKIGYTDRSTEERVKEQAGAMHVPYEILFEDEAMRPDGSVFYDHDVHRVLRRKGFKPLQIDNKNEWYNCHVADVKAAILELKTGLATEASRTATFKMRPEQVRAVQKTCAYFQRAKEEDPELQPKFLWNAKMRFGKTFAAYQLAKKMNFKSILVLTFKPAVESAWREDVMSHVDFEGWQFVSNKDAAGARVDITEAWNAADKRRPIVVFGSLQDLLGTNETGGIKAKNEFIHAHPWDLVIFDEYHFGAWRESAKNLFKDPDEEADADFDVESYQKDEAGNAYNESFLPITTDYYLFLSGTPFRAINSGEFIEEQIYNWTYSDEQDAKEKWKGSDNPYRALPRMVMLTYKIPEDIRQIALQGEFNEFDLNLFFSAKKDRDGIARFTYEREVQKWLALIRGAHLPAAIDDLKLGQDKRPPMPYSDTRLLNVLSHTLWFLPNVAACEAMANLLKAKQNVWFQERYKVHVCAGTRAGVGLDALRPVLEKMENPLVTGTITLSCGKLTTGVTVRPWTGVFMLRNLKSPETYFQTAFRVQSPWTIRQYNGTEEILKKECYVFDFALDRALRQIADYSCRLNVTETNPEKKVGEFIRFLPVLAYDGSTMKQINAQDVLDIALAGTSATLLARRWESALLVNVDNDTLRRLMADERALAALMSIEGFRRLNQDIETIINKSEAVKKAKQEGGAKSKKEKKELSDEEKEYKSLRKQIQEKLIKFATRVPIFMYLTDYRETCLKDVITQLEPGLFKKVTGLNVKDFEILCSLGVFNASLMNDAIFKFKRYEDASLSYTGVNRHDGSAVGGWDTVIQEGDYRRLFYNQQAVEGSGGLLRCARNDVSGVRDSGRGLPRRASAARNDGVPQRHCGEPPQRRHCEERSDEAIHAACDGGLLRCARNDVSGMRDSGSGLLRSARNDEETVTVPKPFVGMKVTHKLAQFGVGEVVKVDKSGRYIWVRFAKNVKKQFAYPSAFTDGFLKV